MNARWISRIATLVLSMAAFGLAAGDALSQDYPKKPITYIVPYGPGSGNDIIARVISQKIGDSMGHPLVVENRSGAAGAIGTELTAKATPDGHTILIASTSQAMVNSHSTEARPTRPAMTRVPTEGEYPA